VSRDIQDLVRTAAKVVHETRGLIKVFLICEQGGFGNVNHQSSTELLNRIDNSRGQRLKYIECSLARPVRALRCLKSITQTAYQSEEPVDSEKSVPAIRRQPRLDLSASTNRMKRRIVQSSLINRILVRDAVLLGLESVDEPVLSQKPLRLNTAKTAMKIAEVTSRVVVNSFLMLV
jgi:hypothetical protein